MHMRLAKLGCDVRATLSCQTAKLARLPRGKALETLLHALITIHLMLMSHDTRCRVHNLVGMLISRQLHNWLPQILPKPSRNSSSNFSLRTVL